MIDHDTVRDVLLERSGSAVLPPEVEAHLSECADCRGLAEALREVDGGLAALPPREVPDTLYARTMERIETPPPADAGALALLGGLAAGLLGGLLALVRLAIAPFTRPRVRRWSLIGGAVAVPALALLAVGTSTMMMRSPDAGSERNVSWLMEAPEADEAEVLLDGEEVTGQGLPEQPDAVNVIEELGRQVQIEAPGYIQGGLQADQQVIALARLSENQEGLDQPSFHDLPPDDGVRAFAAGMHRGEEAQGSFRYAEHGGEGRDRSLEAGDDEDGRELPPGGHRITLRAPSVDPTDGWLADRDRAEGLTFAEASGHWASTYIPGDPAMRLVRRRLADSPDALALAQLAEPAALGIDPPAAGALALDVTADRPAVEGRSRVLLQVGIRGAPARAGRRPALRVQVVIDARRPLDTTELGRVRALLTSLSRGRRGSDRIGVTVAGPRGGELLPLGSLRFGELTVALRRLDGAAPAAPADQAMALPDALRSAVESVGRAEDPASPLGAALVLVLTPGLTDEDSRALEPSVHAGTLGGVTTTAIALRDDVALDTLDRLALAGQGRRMLAGARDADALVRSELEAVSRVVARAVRLRVRLAPGVSLVSVVDSRRLDVEETRRVRAAEQAIDRELARRLGIVSDRDAEEDGVQIVMPAFYADDEHAILLDLVVPGPGPVADVSLRFKDLARAENGSANERLTLARGADRRGPGERRVLARLLAHELAASLRRAAAALDAGDVPGAHAQVARARLLVEGARTRLPELAADAALAHDLTLCARYEAALIPGAVPGPLADSLRYASRRRLQGDPIGL